MSSLTEFRSSGPASPWRSAARAEPPEIQLGGRQLLVDGKAVNIGARAFDVLSYLMKHPDRVVAKKELLDAAWPGLIVEENNLQVQISALRRVLGRDAISTVPGQGYQFTALPPTRPAPLAPAAPQARIVAPASPPVMQEAEPAQMAPPRDAETVAPMGLTRKPVLVAALALSILLGGAFVAWRANHAPASTPLVSDVRVDAPVPFAHSIAVLPFTDMSEKKDMQYFSDGLSEEILHLLSRVPELRVAARTSSFSLRNESDDLPTIARKLKVANVLEGSVRRSGDELRITAQLVRADNGSALWSQTYTRKVGDVFRTQEEIAASVVQALHLSMLGQSLPKAVATGSINAYTLFLQGRSLRLHASTKDDWDKVAETARATISADVNFAPGWAFFSCVLSEQAFLGFIASEDGWAGARLAAVRALSLDPTLPEGHSAMAAILIRHDWNWAAAQKQIEYVLQQDPGNAQAMGWAGYLAQAQGQTDRAITYYENAIANDPLDPKKYNLLAQALIRNGRFAEARIALGKALSLDSGQAFSHWILAKMDIVRGDAAAALVELEREPQEEIRLVGRAIALHALGRNADSDAALRELEGKYAASDPADIALVHAVRGDADRAFSWLDRAMERRDPDCVFVKAEPLFQGIRPDARFAAFLRKMKLPA